MISVDGSAEVALATSADEERLDTVDYQFFQGLTANRRIIFTRNTAGQTDLFSIRIDGTDERVLANSPDSEFSVDSH